MPAGVTDQQSKSAFVYRFETATKDAIQTGTVTHTANTDRVKFPDGLGTYWKGLKQSSSGIPLATSFQQFLKACGVKAGGPLGDFENPKIMLGGVRKLNGPLGAFMLQQVGKDSAGFGDAVVPTPPALGSIEYAIELVELCWASLLRDVPFTEYATNATAQAAAAAAAAELTSLSLAHPGKYAGPLDASGTVTPGDRLFRGGLNTMPGYFNGETIGPYLSQFCMIPTTLGRLSLDQKIKTYRPGQDFMTRPTDFDNIQQCANPVEIAVFDDVHRFMHTGQDTAAYTQVDKLYQAYTIANPVVPSVDGLTLDAYSGPDVLTVNGELHKLAHNVSFGHGIHAGIHWRSDTDYSILLGEAVAIAFLEGQIYSCQENFDVTIAKIDGTPHQFKYF